MTLGTRVETASTLVLLLVWSGCATPPRPEAREVAKSAITASDPRLGAWERLPHGDDEDPNGSGAVVEITDTHFTWATTTRIDRGGRILERTDGAFVVSFWGNRERLATTLGEDDTLTLTWTPTETRFKPDPQRTERRYRRLVATPAALDRSPLPLGHESMDDEAMEALRGDFAVRLEQDQAVRAVFSQGGEPSPEDMAKMMAVDRDNTAWLVELIAHVGWIGAERFGVDAARTAFLIVQHSGDLRLMLTALPHIKQDVDSDALHGGPYALLYDRSALNQGLFQRYGSQLTWGPDGLVPGTAGRSGHG